jgi:hypothetical protein
MTAPKYHYRISNGDEIVRIIILRERLQWVFWYEMCQGDFLEYRGRKKEVSIHDTFDEAKRYLIRSLNRRRGHAEKLAEELDAKLQQVLAMEEPQ